MTIRLSAILDSLFSGFICFFVCFLLLSYFFARTQAIVVSLIFCALVIAIALKRLSAKNALLKLKKTQEKQKQACISALNMCTQSQVLGVFSKAIEKLGKNAKSKNGALFIDEKSVVLFFKFSFDGITKTDVVRAFNALPKNYTAYIFASEFSSELLSFIDRFDKKIVAVDGVKTYKFLSKTDCIPQSELNFKSEKLTFTKAKLNLIKRKNAKRYFSFGVTFLFMSLFVPLKLYYVICGCLFLTFSLLCRLYGKSV